MKLKWQKERKDNEELINLLLALAPTVKDFDGLRMVEDQARQYVYRRDWIERELAKK